MKMNPQTKYMGVRSWMRPLHSVASQQKICTPLAIAIIMLDAVKYDSPICGRSGGEHVVHPQPESRRTRCRSATAPCAG